MKTSQIYQIKIALKHSKPSIWRRVLIHSDIEMDEFSDIIQIAMGWEGYHFHQFIKGREFFVEEVDDDFGFDMQKSYQGFTVSDFFLKEKTKIRYEYDFGDGWDHDITLEKILPVDNQQNYPICIKGKMSCPPEDCGGIGGYYNMLEILSDKKDPEREEYLEWLGEEFDSEFFDIDKVNEQFK